MHDYRPPTTADALKYFKSLKHSAPGPHGIPYAGWVAGGEDSALILVGITGELRKHPPPKADFCHSFQELPHKGSKIEDSECVKGPQRKPAP